MIKFDLDNLIKNKLLGDFYNRSPIFVAQDLIGKYLCKVENNDLFVAKISETEAYLSENDQASHSFKGKTNRNKSMFDSAGTLYIYKIYGIHYCMNAVTESENVGSAVLIRAAEPIIGIDKMKALRNTNNLKNLCSGPGKITQAFNFDLNDDGISLLNNYVFISDLGNQPNISSSTRIGITKSADLMYRFFERDSRFISRI